MRRFTACGLAALVWLAPASAVPAPKKPSAEEIRNAIADLGDKKFAVREKASKFLADAGREAEPFLEEAVAKSPDGEIAERARLVLDKFRWGIYPDTDPEHLKLIEKFRAGEIDVRVAALGEVMKLKPVPFELIPKLLARETDENNQKLLFASLAVNVRSAVPEAVVSGSLDQAAKLLEMGLASGEPSAYADYAAFLYQTDKLTAALTKTEADAKQKDKAGDAARELLPYLYHAKGDVKAALKAAHAVKQADLVEGIAFAARDWKTLADAAKAGDGTPVGARAAYQRLAGQTDKLKESLDKLTKDLDAVEGNDEDVKNALVPLILNGRLKQAMDLMADKKVGLGMLFDLLCASCGTRRRSTSSMPLASGTRPRPRSRPWTCAAARCSPNSATRTRPSRSCRSSSIRPRSGTRPGRTGWPWRRWPGPGRATWRSTSPSAA